MDIITPRTTVPQCCANPCTRDAFWLPVLKVCGPHPQNLDRLVHLADIRLKMPLCPFHKGRVSLRDGLLTDDVWNTIVHQFLKANYPEPLRQHTKLQWIPWDGRWFDEPAFYTPASR